MISIHYLTERGQREALIQKIGIGTIVKSVVVDRGHVNGAEIHNITSTGIIIIQNQQTKKVVTKIIARPGQIKRYYNNNAPEELIAIASEHQKKKKKGAKYYG